MSEWLNRVHFGDCLETLRRMPDGIVNTCVTSPPYFGLRDYGHAGQIGLEETPEQFIAKLVEVFREVRRVLRDDGTTWVNMGDTYCTVPHGPKGANAADPKNPEARLRDGDAANRKALPGIKHKDLIGVPWMLAFALRADGWHLRQDIIWAKPNPMPESVQDRCTKAHEYIFLLSKGPRYYCDMEAIKEPSTSSEADLARAKVIGRGEQSASGAYLGSPQRDKSGGFPTRARAQSFKREGSKREEPVPGQAVGTHRPDRAESDYDLNARNKRSVWTVSTKPYSGAHFATFPTDLIEPCILAGAPAGGVVLDPFFGSGTTGEVAQNLGRNWIGCELNPAYKPLQDQRLSQPGLMLESA